MTTITIPLTSEQRVALMHAESLTIELPESEHGRRAKESRNCHDVVRQLTQLAMTYKDEIHIFVDYSSHTNAFAVTAHAADVDYQANEHRGNYLLERTNVWLQEEGALKKLLDIEDKLIDLIAEARDKAEVAA